MKKKIIYIVLALTLILAACSPKLSTAPMPSLRAPSADGVTSEQTVAGSAPMATNGYGYDAAKNITDTTTSPTSQDRLVIMNVDLSIVVVDPQKKMDVIQQIAKDLGGYLVSLNISQVPLQNGASAPQGSITIRVPAAKLDTALSQIKAEAVDVPTENHTGQDVTAQYVDLQSQLNNLEQAEKDLLAIMDEAKNNPGNDSTTKTQDVLNVYNQIVSIRGQIEQIKGQMKYYEESVAYSLVSVTLIAQVTAQPIQIGPWSPKTEFNKAVVELVHFLQGFVDFLTHFFVNVLLPMIIILGPLALIIWGIVALAKWRKAKKAKAA